MNYIGQSRQKFKVSTYVLLLTVDSIFNLEVENHTSEIQALIEAGRVRETTISQNSLYPFC